MTHIPANIREQVLERANGFCEYCFSSIKILIKMEIDHIIPVVDGGDTHPENLCLACHHCNNYKRGYTVAFDALTGVEVPLFNPRTQEWLLHFEWSQDKTRILGLTAIGRATTQRLKMNHPAIVRARHIWLRTGWLPPNKHPE